MGEIRQKRHRSRIAARRRKDSPGRAASLGSHGPHARPCPDDRHARAEAHSGTIPFRRMSHMRNFRSSPAQRRDHYQELTDKIIAALEAGTAPWRRPWDKAAAGGATAPVNAATGHRYRGINLFVLGMSPLAFASNDPRWCSYRQAAARGLAGPQGREGDAGLFLQADRDRGQNERRRTGDAAHPDPAHVLGLSRLPDRRNPGACACGGDEGRGLSGSRTSRSSFKPAASPSGSAETGRSTTRLSTSSSYLRTKHFTARN